FAWSQGAERSPPVVGAGMVPRASWSVGTRYSTSGGERRLPWLADVPTSTSATANFQRPKFRESFHDLTDDLRQPSRDTPVPKECDRHCGQPAPLSGGPGEAGASFQVGREPDGAVQPTMLMFRMVEFQRRAFDRYVEERPDQWRGVHGLWDLVGKA